MRLFGFKKRHLSEHDFEIAKYTAQITQNPLDSEPYVRRANVWLIHKSDYDRAIADYTQAIRLKPTDPTPYYWRGHALRNKGLYREAMDNFNEASRLCPSDPEYRRGLALCYAQMHEYANAIKEYTQLIALDPKRTSWYLKERAELHKSTGDYTEAIHDLQTVVDFSPGDENLYGRLAELYDLAGNPQEALSSYSKAIEMGMQIEAKLRSSSNEHDEPLRSQLANLELVSEWYLSRGLLNLRLGKRDEALADLNNFVFRSKNAAKVDEVARMIKDMDA